MRAGFSLWCDRVWNGVLTPLSGKMRLLVSRLILKAETRVISAAKASTWRSNMSFTCSSQESGTPSGAEGSSLVGAAALCRSMALDAALDGADFFEIAVEPAAVGCTEIGAKAGGIGGRVRRGYWLRGGGRGRWRKDFRTRRADSPSSAGERWGRPN